MTARNGLNGFSRSLGRRETPTQFGNLARILEISMQIRGIDVSPELKEFAESQGAFAGLEHEDVLQNLKVRDLVRRLRRGYADRRVGDSNLVVNELENIIDDIAAQDDEEDQIIFGRALREARSIWPGFSMKFPTTLF